MRFIRFPNTFNFDIWKSDETFGILRPRVHVARVRSVTTIAGRLLGRWKNKLMGKQLIEAVLKFGYQIQSFAKIPACTCT